ncbi:MAG: hypothetical protein K0Q79_2557 [Flavipsychrobacter sp.]|jgi:hypothetical protein|nr:hypothetical protein [Flavipsychrobacter sp.]
MLHCRAKLFFFFFILLGVKASAQLTGENNPYSKYGIGELVNSNNAALRAMGNITSAYKNPNVLNSDNPSSYAFMQHTTFEIGGTASTRAISGSGFNYNTGTAKLAYVNMGFPIGKNAGLSFGFKPYAYTYYTMVDTLDAGSSPVGRLERRYNGDGGINYAYLGGAAKYKGLSIGFNLGYMFGTIRSITRASPIDTPYTRTTYTSFFNNYTRIGGLNWKVGVMYERKLDSNYTLRLGGTFALNQNLFERLNAYQISHYYLPDTLIYDTLYNSGEQQGKLTLPMSFSIGAMLVKNNKWGAGIDFSLAQWSGYKSTPDTLMAAGVGSSSYKLSLGGELTPDVNSIRNYLARVTYRLGMYYGTDYLKLNNTALPCYGVTAGASLPFRRSQSQLHFAVDVGRLGTTEKNLMQHTYVRFTLGVSINDRWFVRKKYD